MMLDIANEYASDITAGIADFFKDKEVNTIMCQVKLPDIPYGFFEYQYWTCTRLLESDSIDAIIIVSSFFVSTISVQKFESLIRGLSSKPVVSIGADLSFSNSCTLKNNCQEVYNELIEHLSVKHNLKKIAFLSADNSVSQESLERFEAFKAALKKNNLQFDPDLVYEGNFTTGSGEQAMKDFKSKEDIPFEAIVCANDLMALGVMKELQKKGISIPGDIVVTGFDNSVQCQVLDPSLTTIGFDISDYGRKSAELIYRKLKGENIPSENFFPMKNYFRESCGCDRTDELIKHFENSTLNQYLNANQEKRNLYTLLDVLQFSESLTDLFTRFHQILFSVDIRRIAVCLFDEPVVNTKEDYFQLPQEVELSLAIDREHGTELIQSGIRFNPLDNLLPENVFNEDFDEYILEPVFYGDKVYGYFFFKPGERNNYQAVIYMKYLSSAIASSFEYSRKQEENIRLSQENQDLIVDNDKLDETSKTDELTQVFNRRGFMVAGKQILALTHSMIKKGSVFFVDMDGLKKINDNYGHNMGDEAIKAVAKALKKAFSLNDVIGRLGGDEFAIISGEVTGNSFDEKYNLIHKKLNEIVKRKNLPFDISVSMGVVEFTNRDSDLEKLLTRADEKQYQLKKTKKNK